ncbi:MAG TPA: 30S ribosomal protein S12 methylthiotransferase RimO [Acidobacteriota bacterium]|nr:30S ribosomal protein S12 methylthiotransferase RimO [Acidobacteriota bacterium]
MAKVGFVSLGCPKNLVDSEVMLGLLSREGHEITSSQEQAEIIVINTCGFIESAKQESINTILEMAQQKWKGNCRRLIVAGCLVERYRQEIQTQIPEVDAVIGTNEIPNILQACSNGSATSLGSPQSTSVQPLFLYTHTDPRILATPPYMAYIKIAEGCDHPCSFCAIPRMRGPFRSRRLDSIVAEARDLVKRGVREINLIGQDTTMYGWDWGQKTGLADLIRALGKIEELRWVRFLYAYPNNIYPELLRAVAETPNACKYVDLPLQHASSRILKKMKRGGNRLSLLKLLERIRNAIPGVAIRTTMIVGFPGETEADFEELVDFVKAAQFDRLGVFAYSDEEQTPAYDLAGKVPQSVAERRRKRLMRVQKQISRRRNRELIGQRLPVLIEGPSRESDLLWAGRLSTQAPEIDGVVYLNDGIDERVRPGDVRDVLISEAYDYDLVGAVV